MASGFAGDPVYGLPRTGALVTQDQSLPVVQTVLDVNKRTRVTITRTAGDKGHISSGPNKNDYYHQ